MLVLLVTRCKVEIILQETQEQGFMLADTSLKCTCNLEKDNAPEEIQTNVAQIRSLRLFELKLTSSRTETVEK